MLGPRLKSNLAEHFINEQLAYSQKIPISHYSLRDKKEPSNLLFSHHNTNISTLEQSPHSGTENIVS